MRRSTLKWRWLTAALVALALVLVAGRVALAEGTGSEPTAMSIGTPTTAGMGQTVTLQARLVDDTGSPIEKAAIDFVTPTSFLSGSGDVVVARAVTDKQGLAVARYQVRSAGQTTVRAEYKGDDRYAATTATAQMTIVGTDQLYTQKAGVAIPFLNEPPAFVSALGISPQSLPRLSGWPIAATLLVVWSLYGFVVTLIFRVALAGAREKASSEPGRRETRVLAGAPQPKPDGALPVARKQEANS